MNKNGNRSLKSTERNQNKLDLKDILSSVQVILTSFSFRFHSYLTET
jgi:hypothetical protein